MNSNYKYPTSTFEANPTIDSLFVFPDGNCFIKQSDADSYAKATKREYTVMQREGSKAEPETNQETENKPKKYNKK